MAQTVGEVQINGDRFRIDLKSYKMKDMSDFSPRASTPGGSIVVSELGLYQVQMQQDFRHGFGWHRYEDAMGYQKTEGNIDTRHEAAVLLYTAAASSDTDNARKDGMCQFNGDIYTWGASGLRKYSGGSWTSVYSTLPVNHALPTKTYLFFAPDGGRIQKLDTSGNVTDAGSGTGTQDFKRFAVFQGFLYGFVDGTNEVHYSAKVDMSDMEGVTTDPNIIYCGSDGFPILDFVSYAGQLYAVKGNGIWLLAEDKKSFRPVLDYKSEYSTNNFAGITVFNGMVYYSLRNQVISWNGSRYTRQSPRPLTNVFPVVTYGNFRNFVECDGFLYCTARTNETTYKEALLCFDGAFWHKLADLITDGSGTITMLGIDTINYRLWYHLDSATSDVTYYIPLQTLSDYPYASFPTTGNHYLYLSPMDAGFWKVTKSTASLAIEGTNLTTARYLQVEYMLDNSGTWVVWGTATTNGVTVLFTPGGNRTVEYETIQYRIKFVTDSAAQSPVLTRIWFDLLMRPDEFYGFGFNVIVGDSLVGMEQQQDSRTTREVVEDLIAARASKSPIVFVCPEGITHYCYVTSVLMVGVEMDPNDQGLYPRFERVAQINLVEVKPNG